MPVVGWKTGRFEDQNDRLGEELAKTALKRLCDLYPGYSWIVEVNGGCLIIRNYTLDWRGRYCMVLKLSDVQHDHTRLIRNLQTAAGEFLERAHMKRGAFVPGQESNPVLEGAPLIGAKRWTPQPKAEDSPQIVIAKD